MDNEGISVELTVLEQHHSLELQESPDATLDLIDSLDSVDNLDDNTESEYVLNLSILIYPHLVSLEKMIIRRKTGLILLFLDQLYSQSLS